MPAICHCNSESAKSMSTQQDPRHQIPCSTPKRSASMSAARPKADNGRWEWHLFRHLCLNGEVCQRHAINAKAPAWRDGSLMRVLTTMASAFRPQPPTTQIAAYPIKKSVVLLHRRSLNELIRMCNIGWRLSGVIMAMTISSQPTLVDIIQSVSDPVIQLEPHIIATGSGPDQREGIIMVANAAQLAPKR